MTGREIGAEEALQIGLANRVVPTGQALGAAQLLAAQIAAFPPAAMLADRASAHAGVGLDLQQALAAEFGRGLPAVTQGIDGARRFVQ